MTEHLPASLFSRRAFLAWTGRSLGAAALLAGAQTARAAPDTTLDAKIGQMLMVGLRGSSVSADHPIVQDIIQRHLGGVILLDWAGNILSPPQVTALTEGLQALSQIPMLVAIDHEGGIINRLKERYGFPPTVSHERLGSINDLEVTHTQATIMAQTLAQARINLNLAPVVDVNTNPNNPIIARYQRSFSPDPAIVTAHASMFVQAHHEQGVFCTLKHFPGHGSSSGDSHIGLVDVTHTWDRTELKPYNELIAAGRADMIMTAHVFNTVFDVDYPATLSRHTITGLLRETMGYGGVVISDDMLMGAITHYYGFEMAIQKSIEAGVDILLFAGIDPGLTRSAHNHIKRLVQSGIISEARIDESYQRILRLKQQLYQDIAVPAPPLPEELTFAETGHSLSGPFLDYWRQHGGLEQFGYPLTSEFTETGYTVQYFERARFEYHPEHAGTAHEVQLGPLGRIITRGREHEPAFRRAVPGQQPGRFFPETGHHLDLRFLDHWEQNGGLPIYGYPISEAFRETSLHEGQTYVVQYFERARFEYHPENEQPYKVLLGRLGVEVLRRRD